MSGTDVLEWYERDPVFRQRAWHQIPLGKLTERNPMISLFRFLWYLVWYGEAELEMTGDYVLALTRVSAGILLADTDVME